MSAIKDRLVILDPLYSRALSDPQNPFFGDLIHVQYDSITLFQSSKKKNPIMQIALVEKPLWREQRSLDLAHFCQSLQNPTNEEPLKGLKIAIDPGHIGGRYCELEGRLYTQSGAAICEGDMNLEISLILKNLLETEGSSVFLSRYTNEPVSADSDNFPKNYFKSFIRGEYEKRIVSINDFNPDITILIHLNMGNEPGLYDGINAFVPGNFYQGELNSEEDIINFLELLFSPNIFINIKAAATVISCMTNELDTEPFRLFRFGRPELRKYMFEIPGTHEGIMARNLYMLRKIKSPVFLIEGPHINYEPNFKKFQDETESHTFILKIAESIASGLVEFVSSCKVPN
ncbi:MAG: N-acetylmuramoyl-L-alanine amidase [bacterium]